MLRLNGSPRTAARQLVELLTRDNVFDEDGNLNPAAVRAANRYVAPHGEGLEITSPGATDGSSESRKSETPDAKSEPCTEEAESEPDGTSHTQTPQQGGS